MNRLNDFSFSSRLLLAFGVVPAAALGVALLAGASGPLALWLVCAAVLCGGILAFLAGRAADAALARTVSAVQALADGRFVEPADAPTATFGPLAAALDSLRKGVCAARAKVEHEQAQLRTAQEAQPRENAAHKALLAQLQQSLSAIREVVDATVAGDLTRRVDTRLESAELRAMGEAVNSLVLNMGTIVQGIQSTAGDVNRAADEISTGNENLSQRTEEQSSSLEETASSMEEMTTTVKQNADNAAQANQLALMARDQAERGGIIVNQAIAAMSDINQSSKKIADIIGVIDEIAFQTNLLALNAAVEAARAGEQGRGFAVVASEVRSLAGRSATAAKEIKGLIQDSVRKVEDGSARVTQSGQTLEEIVASVKKVSDIVAEIAAASREQSAGIEQVNRAVMQMDELTQQNATLVEQATTAARNMSALAETLDQNMARYRLGGQTGGKTAAYATDGSLRRAIGG
ncbi:MAG: methyl-accepting chemotaxis protein [Steroidobacteraceae bacterium]